MSLTHCPLCVGLAVLSVLRAAAHLALLALLLPQRRRRPRPASPDHASGRRGVTGAGLSMS